METTHNQQTEQTAKHTPGPWRMEYLPNGIDESGQAEVLIRAFYTPESTLEGILACIEVDGSHDHDRLANARLIATAPQLLDALARAVAQFDFTVAAMAKGQTVSISSLQNCAAAARAAIAKVQA